MPFVIDEIAVGATEIAEIAESSEVISEEILAQEFDPSNFKEELIDIEHTPEIEHLEDETNADSPTSSTEFEFSPENFDQKHMESPQKVSDSNGVSVFEDQISETKDLSENENINEVKQIKTINSHLEGQSHPITGVEFERKVVTNEVEEKVEGVFPQFESKFDAQLPENLELASDAEQFKECNRQLKEKYDSDSSFRDQFEERQKDDIENGDTPYGYTWHHSEEAGKMQLVDYDIHQKTGHTGGRSIWGGGSVYR